LLLRGKSKNHRDWIFFRSFGGRLDAGSLCFGFRSLKNIGAVVTLLLNRERRVDGPRGCGMDERDLFECVTKNESCALIPGQGNCQRNGLVRRRGTIDRHKDRLEHEARFGGLRLPPPEVLYLEMTLYFTRDGASHAYDCLGDNVARGREVKPSETASWHTEIRPVRKCDATTIDECLRGIISEV